MRLALGAACAVLLLASGCSAGSETVAADVGTDPVSSPATPSASADQDVAPDYGTCEELGPVFTRRYEYNMSLLDENRVVFEMPTGGYLVHADDATCLAKFPEVADEVAHVINGLHEDQRSECRSAIKKLTAPASEQNEASRPGSTSAIRWPALAT